ncbi:MAG: Hsp20/alpha crystallin family protein [Bacillota bacterium]
MIGLRPTVWNPFKEIKSLRDQMNQFLDETFQAEESSLQPSVDIYEEGNELVIKVDIPGINPSDVEIMVSEDSLMLQGEINQEEQVQRDKYHKVERQRGRFKRAISLPFKVKREQATATAEHGVLELRVPKSEQEIEKITKLEIND